jgi:hypothetical protein
MTDVRYPARAGEVQIGSGAQLVPKLKIRGAIPPLPHTHLFVTERVTSLSEKVRRRLLISWAGDVARMGMRNAYTLFGRKSSVEEGY